MLCNWLFLSMEIKVKFDPIVDNYLKTKYPNGIRYDLTDNLTIFMFSLLMVPKQGEISKDETDGVSILLTKQFYHCGRVFIPDRVKEDVSKYIVNHITNELFNELLMLIQNNRYKRYKGIRHLIKNYLIRYNLDQCAEIERFKKAFYRFQKKQENILPDFVPMCPLD